MEDPMDGEGKVVVQCHEKALHQIAELQNRFFGYRSAEGSQVPDTSQKSNKVKWQHGKIVTGVPEADTMHGNRDVILRSSLATLPYNSFALYINRDENNTSSVSQQELRTGCSVHLRCWLYFMYLSQTISEKQGCKSQYFVFLFFFRVCWIHHVTGVWVYPLLEHLSPGVKIIFFAAVTVIINIFYLMGEVLNNYIWDTQKCFNNSGREENMDSVLFRLYRT
ncbi:Androgen-induced gene 1 protein-like protein [Aix galericulata]|nr:Androgen-induced gene 1 protein-like protein [Aix galericulata]